MIGLVYMTYSAARLYDIMCILDTCNMLQNHAEYIALVAYLRKGQFLRCRIPLLLAHRSHYQRRLSWSTAASPDQ